MLFVAAEVHFHKIRMTEPLASTLLGFAVRKMDVVVVASHQVLYMFTANPVNMMAYINGFSH